MQLIELSIMEHRGGSKGEEWILKAKERYSTFNTSISVVEQKYFNTEIYKNIYLYTCT